MSIARIRSTALDHGLALAALVGGLLWPAAAVAGERAFVLDSKAGAVVAVDLATGQVVGRSTAAGASELIGVGDGSRVLALDPGDHKLTFCCGFQPKTPITATLVDTTTVQQASRLEVGWGMPATSLAAGFSVIGHAEYQPSLDGQRVSFVCAGYHSKKPEEEHAKEVVTIDVRSGQVVGRLPLDRQMTLVGRAGATETAVLFDEAKEGKEPAPAELVFVDLATHAIVSRLTLDGAPERPFVTGDGAWLYLLDPGKPSNKKEKNIDGTLYVVSLAERKLAASLPAGSGPQGFVWDAAREQALMTSDGAPVEKGQPRPGVLRVLHGGEVVATLDIAEDPHLVRISGNQAYVAGKAAISIVDLAARRVTGQIAVEHAGGIDEISFSPDGKRAFALYDASSKLSVLDLEKAQLVGSLATGRGGVKFAKALGAVALSVAATTASYYSGMAGAQARGGGYFHYNIYNFGVAAAETGIAVRPDGRFAYALNTQTNDVTVVDTAAATASSKEAAKGRALAPLTGGTRFAVLGKDELRVFDTESQKPGEPLTFEDAAAVRLRFSRDGGTAIAYGGKSCYVLDGRTGAVKARVDGLLGASDVLFAGGDAVAAPSATAEPAAAPPAPPTPEAPAAGTAANPPTGAQ